MKDSFKLGLLILIIAAIGYGFGRFTAPEKIVEKEKIVIKKVDRIVIKKVDVIKEIKVENKNINTKTTVTEHPDGRVETITEIIDTTTVSTNTDTDSNTDTNRDTVADSETSKEKTTINKKSQWKFTALAGLNLSDYSKPIYGGVISRRVLGPIYVDGWGLNNGTVGVGVSFEF